MPLLPKPTSQSVRTLHSKLLDDWSDTISHRDELRGLINGTNKIETLKESSDRNMVPIEVHSRRAGGILEHANGLIMASPKFHAEPLSLYTEDVRESEQIEKVAGAFFQQQLIANDFWPSVGRDVLGYGMGFAKSMLSLSEWTPQAGYPVRGENEEAKSYLERIRKWKTSEGKFPFIIKHIPVNEILAHLDYDNNVLATIEPKWVPANILANDMGSIEVSELLDRGSLNWWDELLVVEYIDCEWVGYYLAGIHPRTKTEIDLKARNLPMGYEELRVWEHKLGKHPVVMFPGITTKDSELRHRFKSFLDDAKEALETYDFIISRLATMIWAYYLPSYVWHIPQQTAAFVGKERPNLPVRLGGVTTLYGDEQLVQLPVPQELQYANLLLVQCEDLIQRHALEDVLFGRVAGSAPAYQVNLRINVARSKLTPIAQHMAVGMTKLLELFFRGVEQLGEAVPIGGEKITVKMAKAYRERVTASITPKSPIDRNQDIGVANMALEFGLPWDWIVEHILDVEDPATLKLMSDIRKLETSPMVQQRLLQDALERLDLLVQQEDYTGLDKIDMSKLSPEAATVLNELAGAQGQGMPGAGQPVPAGAGGGQPVPPEPQGGLGRGPFPEGSGSQSVQGGRGLMTPKAQPLPGQVTQGEPNMGAF